MLDVTAIGEILIDFTPVGVSDQGNPIYEQNPGGAPANVLACLSKLGCSTAFIGKVGEDEFGTFLEKIIKSVGISTDGLVTTGNAGTTLAFVHLDEKGERNFSFYRNPGADLLLHPDEINKRLIDDCAIFHFGSVSLTGEPSRSATLEAVRYASERRKVISYDPNLRLRLWSTTETAKKEILNAMKMADLVKVSDEELSFLTGKSDLFQAAKDLIKNYNLKLLLVTMGAEGAIAYNQNGFVSMPGFAVNVVDTTGAGDAFTAGFLYKLLKSKKRLEELNLYEMKGFLTFANAVGALTTTRRGAISALPNMTEIDTCIAEGKLN